MLLLDLIVSPVCESSVALSVSIVYNEQMKCEIKRTLENKIKNNREC